MITQAEPPAAKPGEKGKEMGFRSWLVNYTGLTRYDFRVLDLEGESAPTVRNLFKKWAADERPTQEQLTDAINAANVEGFDVATAERGTDDSKRD